MARILAYTSPAAGHLFPLVPGLLELRARGHDVHLRTGARLLGVARAAGLGTPSRPTRDRRDRGPTTTGPARRRQAAAGLAACWCAGRSSAPTSIARSPRSDPDPIVVDTNSYGATVSAAGLGAARGRRPAVAAAAPRQGHPALRPGAGAGAQPARARPRPRAVGRASTQVREGDAAAAERAACRRGPARAALPRRAPARARPAARAHGRAARVPAHRPARARALRRRPAVGPARRGPGLARRTGRPVGARHDLDRVPGRRGARARRHGGAARRARPRL